MADSSEKSRLIQHTGPPPYQEPSQYPNGGYPPPGNYPSTSGYMDHQYGAAVSLCYPGHPAVTVQPAVYVASVQLVSAPPDFLGYSIFTMLFCCLPLGIAALVYSCTAREAVMSGDREIAVNSSRMAYILNNIALGVGLAIITIGIIVGMELSNKSHHYP
ncbi:Synapse differentiation-inducing gene protein 1 [Triplophysa tibetana]|uniref:Synapse differentiation-inducing gene protein 1 n=1 Tax=Triplophysa tibetana TaxID=1572043 RepID=A0A5A9N146_9TELE|nr:Synapse differentiation-inducing gene protein 1 [Triplophysa tibetana]KAA0702741.1 Synapse differentiation-inducing gene protein 1 [Triplophysa tibetana]